MLSYRHAFHAGNHADVLKHAILALLLEALHAKETPFRYLETHAGAGAYDLDSPEARRNAEHGQGIGRIRARADAPPALSGYLAALDAVGGPGGRARYPGSPRVARRLLRPDDRMVLCELHPADHALLRAEFAGDRQVAVHRIDGYQGLKAFLPPPERRGLVLIDPPYEVKDEYRRVVDALRAAHRLWPTGVYALWYPVLDTTTHARLLRDLARSGLRRALLAEIRVRPEDGPRGMKGSGMVIINPPWRLDRTLEALLPWLWGALDPERRGGWRVEWLVPE